MRWGVEDEPKDGELAVHQGDWGDVESEEVEGLVGFNDVGDERSDKGFLNVLVRLKDVLVHTRERVHRVLIGVDVDGLFHHFVETTNFVESEGVIDMVVSEEDRVDSGDVFTKNLLAEIRRGIDHDDTINTLGIGELDRGAATGPRVAWI